MRQTFRIPPGATTLLALALALAAGLLTVQDSQGQEEAAPAAEGAPAQSADDPGTAMSETMRLATKSLMLDITNAANRAVAVGERGHVLVSESRRDWRQIENVPTRATLTAVTAVGDKVWAVGHDGVIVHSADGGQTWTRQRLAPFDPDNTDPTVGVPLLDVIFFDESNGLAIGAYSLMLRTTDGGTTWNQVTLGTPAPAEAAPADAAAVAEEPVADDAAAEGEADSSWTFDESELELEEESDPHLNGIARTGDGSLFIVAERGAAFRSTDGGANWQRIQLPYEGSMFGVIGYEGRHVLAFGLRGNVFESTDLGDTWRKIDTGVDLSIMGGAGWGDGGAALVGANGIVLTRSQRGQNLLKHVHPDSAVLSSAISLAEGGELVVAGENGVGTYTPN